MGSWQRRLEIQIMELVAPSADRLVLRCVGHRVWAISIVVRTTVGAKMAFDVRFADARISYHWTNGDLLLAVDSSGRKTFGNCRGNCGSIGTGRRRLIGHHHSWRPSDMAESYISFDDIGVDTSYLDLPQGCRCLALPWRYHLANVV